MELEKQMKKMFGKQRGHRIFFFFLWLYYVFLLLRLFSSCSKWELLSNCGAIVAASRSGAQARGHRLQQLHHTVSVVLTPSL